jgi:SAM-dependent methyltransferase
VSLRRFLRKARLALRRPPRAARDLLPDYDEYLRLQRDEHLSFESEEPRWAEGLRRFVAATFGDVPRDARILDCACGDGTGLAALQALGFSRLAGVDLSPAKVERARAQGFEVLTGDMHDLSAFADGSCGAILCSHTLEHAYEPGRVLAEFHRVLAAGGTLHLVLPFPDPGTRNERAHAAKYELGTHRDDGGDAAAGYVERRGFEIRLRRRDAFREPELWLVGVKRVHTAAKLDSG